MEIRQIKNDTKASFQNDFYYAEQEFYRLLNDDTLSHKIRVERLKEQLVIISNTINAQGLIDRLLPEPQQTQPQPPPVTSEAK